MPRLKDEIASLRFARNDEVGHSTAARYDRKFAPGLNGLDPKHWSAKVKGIGNGYWRVVAEVEDLIEMTAQLKQRTLYGINFARNLIKL